MSEFWLTITLMLTAVIGYFIGFYTWELKWIKKISSWIIVPLPFIVLLLIATPMVIENINGEIILYSAGYPTCLFMGFSVCIFLNRWDIWRKLRIDKAKKAAGWTKYDTKEKKGKK